jgi:hypothetical protein
MSQSRDNSGILGKNDRRTKDTHPTHSGQCTIDGKQYWISGWVKDGRDNSRFFSLAFKLKEPRAAQQQPSGGQKEPAPTTGGGDFDSDIPF